MTDDSKVRVAVRIRPRLSRLGEKFDVDAVQKANETTVLIVNPEDKKTNTFAVDAVFDHSNTGEHVYEESGVDLVDAALQGLHSTIFTYGQTGSGKTYTVLGDTSEWTRSDVIDAQNLLTEDSGLFLRALVDIFTYQRRNARNLDVAVELSILEIYNEMVRDLLSEKGDPEPVLKEDRDNVFIQNVKSFAVSNVMQVHNLFTKANNNRATSSTHMNDRSSRSHALFFIDISQKDRASAKVVSSRLTLVDLAGSERIKRSGVEGDRLKEAQFINKSLSALGMVVNALFMSRGHIPYRDSKLTRLLKNSFSGNCKVLLIANLSPSELSVHESLSTMRFADRVKEMKAEQVNPADREAEAAYLRVAKEHEELVANLRFVQAVHGYSFRFTDSMVGAPNFDDALRSMLVDARERRAKEASDQEIKDRQHVKLKVKQGVDALAESEKQLCKGLNDKLELAVQTRKELEEKVGKQKSSRGAVVDELYGRIREAETARAAVGDEVAALQAQVALLERQEDLLNDEIRNRELEVSKEFEQWTAAFDREDKQWKEENSHWEIEKKIWDAFQKIRKARKLLSKKDAELKTEEAKLQELQAKRSESEAHWVCEGIFADVFRSAVSGDIEAPLPGQDDREENDGELQDASVDFADLQDGRSAESVEAAIRRQQEEIFNRQNLLNDVIRYLEHGCVLMKHGRYGQPHPRHFFIPASHDRISWFDPKHGESGRLEPDSLLFSDVEKFQRGQYTKVFARNRALEASAEFYLSFSLIYEGGKRSLDVVAESEPDYEAWLMVLSEFVGRKAEWGGIMDVSSLPRTELLNAEESAWCQRNHVSPMLFLHVKNHVINSPEMSRGHMRAVSGLDIDRSDALLQYFLSSGLCSLSTAPSPE
eukprot:ANDGO_08305.mRNA.1 Kinesin heavy chain